MTVLAAAHETARQRRVREIKAAAAESLANHQITYHAAAGPLRQWRCRRPASVHYLFDVTTWPGYLAVTGDVGNLVFAPGEADALAWARAGGLRHPDYLAGKALSTFEVEEYDPDVAEDWVRERLADAEALCLGHGALTALRDALRWGTARYGPALLLEELVTAGALPASDPPRWQNYKYSLLWARECLRWLVARLPEQPRPSTP